MTDPLAAMWVDPGTTTGVARAVFEPVHRGEVADWVEAAEWETWEVEGSSGEQAHEIMGSYLDWSRPLILQRAIWPTLGFESFQLRPSKARGAGSTEHMLDPLKVIHACHALAWRVNEDDELVRWVDFDFQEPQKKAQVTSKRLRSYGLWVVGSEHERDAARHLAQWLRDRID